MEETISVEKTALLTAMYKSVERMNRHITEGNPEAAETERHLQRNLRANFEDLLRREERDYAKEVVE